MQITTWIRPQVQKVASQGIYQSYACHSLHHWPQCVRNLQLQLRTYLSSCLYSWHAFAEHVRMRRNVKRNLIGVYLSVYSRSCTWLVCVDVVRLWCNMHSINAAIHIREWHCSFDFISQNRPDFSVYWKNPRDCTISAKVSGQQAGWRVRHEDDPASYKRPPSTSASPRQQSLKVYMPGGVHLPAAIKLEWNFERSDSLCLLPCSLSRYPERKRLY